MTATPGPVRSAPFAELDGPTAYRLWALRSAVFVVEQQAVYLDLDGRDLEPGTPDAQVRRLRTNPSRGHATTSAVVPRRDPASTRIRRRVATEMQHFEHVFGKFVHRWSSDGTTVHRSRERCGRLSVATPSV